MEGPFSLVKKGISGVTEYISSPFRLSEEEKEKEDRESRLFDKAYGLRYSQLGTVGVSSRGEKNIPYWVNRILTRKLERDEDTESTFFLEGKTFYYKITPDFGGYGYNVERSLRKRRK